MDFASVLSAEYADQMLKAGTPEAFDQKVREMAHTMAEEIAGIQPPG